MSTRRLLERYLAWRVTGIPLVLATVVGTAGSTYSKAGHRILIGGDGNWQGLVSGGCLEPDLAGHALEVIATGQSKCLRYEQGSDADELFGAGTGCEGMIRVLLQRLRVEESYEPFASMAEAMGIGLLESGSEGSRLHTPQAPLTQVRPPQECRGSGASRDSAGGSAPVIAVTLVERTGNTRARAGDPTAGATVFIGPGGQSAYGVSPDDAGRLAALARGHIGAQLSDVELGSGHWRALVSIVPPLPRLLVLGAGQDAVPLVQMARVAGFHVTVADHRPAALERSEFGCADSLIHYEPGASGEALPFVGIDAVVVMTHHLATDRALLARIARSAVPWVGLLGPRRRRERLLRELGAAAEALEERLEGPVGPNFGANTPEGIALSILAAIEAHRHGQRLVPVAMERKARRVEEPA